MVATLGRNSAATNLSVNCSDKEVAAHVKSVKELLTQLRKRKASPKPAGKGKAKAKAKAKPSVEEAPQNTAAPENAEGLAANEDERD